MLYVFARSVSITWYPMLFYFAFNWWLVRLNTFYYIYVLISSFGKFYAHFCNELFIYSKFEPFVCYACYKYLFTLWFVFYLLMMINCSFFWWIEVGHFKGVKFIIFSFMLEHYVARLKYPLTLGHEDVCLSYLLNLKN